MPKLKPPAQALSRAGFAYTQAAELNQKVIGRIGQGLNDASQLEALFVAASETKADMTGLREEEMLYRTQMARLDAQTRQEALKTAQAGLKADEAQAKQAAAEAELLASYLM